MNKITAFLLLKTLYTKGRCTIIMNDEQVCACTRIMLKDVSLDIHPLSPLLLFIIRAFSPFFKCPIFLILLYPKCSRVGPDHRSLTQQILDIMAILNS